MPSYEIKVTHLSGSRRNTVETFSLLPLRPLRIGRGEECQLRFDAEADRQVSALHAEIVQGTGGDHLVIKDLGSKNGLTLNGERVEGEAPLPNHGVVEVGLGGPRLQVVYETGGGINFNQIRKDQTSRGQFRPLATTDDALPAPMADLEAAARGGGGSSGLLTLLIAAGMVALAGLAVWWIGFA